MYNPHLAGFKLKDAFASAHIRSRILSARRQTFIQKIPHDAVHHALHNVACSPCLPPRSCSWPSAAGQRAPSRQRRQWPPPAGPNPLSLPHQAKHHHQQQAGSEHHPSCYAGDLQPCSPGMRADSQGQDARRAAGGRCERARRLREPQAAGPFRNLINYGARGTMLHGHFKAAQHRPGAGRQEFESGICSVVCGRK